jgi:hypothetical protein
MPLSPLLPRPIRCDDKQGLVQFPNLSRIVNFLSWEDAIPETKPQTYANHARVDPLFHYFLAPIALILVIASIVHLVRHPHLSGFVHVVLAFALFILLFKVRTYSLRVQDRVIRLEERLRLATLLPEPLRARIHELDIRQLIALRFASDAEIPALVERSLNEKLTQKQIKQAIQNWRADNFRV